MATVIRNIDPLVVPLTTAFNALKVQIGAGSSFHMDASEVLISAAAATDLGTSLTLCNDLIAVVTFHFADAVAHKVVDATALPAINVATTLATAITAANLIKASYNTHCAATAKHYNADATNTIAATDATTQGTLNTLLNEMRTDIAAHMASAPTCASFRLIAM